MTSRRDPVERAAATDRDLYDVATWEPRTHLDRLATRVYGGLKWSLRALVILTALGMLLAQVALSGLGTVIEDPLIVTLVVLSVVPAAGLAAFIWWADVTSGEPLRLIVGTFVLGLLFAMFAALINSVGQVGFAAIPVVGMPLFFYLVVGPVEETVKWLAVRMYAFRDASFDSVIDGAVYGAVAGLGFATIENAIYITRGLSGEPGAAAIIGAVGGTAAVRTLAGPGHVLYSAIAGYYLGLAKFNPRHAGPIVVKGLLIAAFVHGTYNVLVGPVPALLAGTTGLVSRPMAVIAFIVVYDGLLGFWLYRKLEAYRVAFRESRDRVDRDADGLDPEATEFERGVALEEDEPVAANGGAGRGDDADGAGDDAGDADGADHADDAGDADDVDDPDHG